MSVIEYASDGENDGRGARARQVEVPYWIAIGAAGRREVLNSAGRGSRLFIIDFDPATGALALDLRFRDPGDESGGISLGGANWAGVTGKAAPHGAVFSR